MSPTTQHELSAGERLLAVAEDLMHERGYEAVGINELCKAAEAPKGSFYHYFDSKEGLALAMLDRQWDRANQNLFGRSFAAPGTLRERFESFAHELAEGQRRLAEPVDGPIRGCRFGNFALELSTTHPRVRAKVEEVLDAQVEWYASALRDALRAGEVRQDLDIASTARSICAQMEGLMMLAKVRQDTDVILSLPDAVDLLVQ